MNNNIKSKRNKKYMVYVRDMSKLFFESLFFCLIYLILFFYFFGKINMINNVFNIANALLGLYYGSIYYIFCLLPLSFILSLVKASTTLKLILNACFSILFNPVIFLLTLELFGF